MGVMRRSVDTRRYVANRFAARLEWLPTPVRRSSAACTGLLYGAELTSIRNKARRLLQGLPLEPTARYGRYMSWLDESKRTSLYTDDFAAQAKGSPAADVIAEAWDEASGEDVLDVMLEVDSSTCLPGDLIPKIDIATMAYDLEARSPFLDHELMELAASIPARFKVRDAEKKWFLRDALREWLPNDILDHPKRGFSVPIGHWLRNERSGAVRDLLLDSRSIGRGYFRQDAVQSLINRHTSGADEETKPLWALCML